MPSNPKPSLEQRARSLCLSTFHQHPYAETSGEACPSCAAILAFAQAVAAESASDHAKLVAACEKALYLYGKHAAGVHHEIDFAMRYLDSCLPGPAPAAPTEGKS